MSDSDADFATALYRLTDADGETIDGEIYEDSGRAIDARVRLMNEHPDGEDVTVEVYERAESEVSRYVTVFYQIRETDHAEPGDRYLVLGEETDDRYSLDEESEGFIKTSRPIAVIDAGVEMTEEEMGEWCNSHAGKAVLNQYFPEIEPEDPTLPGFGEQVEVGA